MTHSPEPLTDVWRHAKFPNMLLLCVFPPLHPLRRTNPSLPESQQHSPPSEGSGPQDTEPSFHGDFANTSGPQKEPSFDSGEPWKLASDHKAQFLCIPGPRNHTQSQGDARAAVEDRGVSGERGGGGSEGGFSGGPLIDGWGNRVAILVRTNQGGMPRGPW